MDSLAPSPVSVARELMQAPLMGSFVALLLYGITCIQTLFYFQTYPEDHMTLKCMVFVLWFLETIHSGLNITFINHYLINNFGNVAALNTIAWDLLAGFGIGFVTGLIVNLFFTLRIWRFTQSLWAGSILTFLNLARFALSTSALILGAIYSESWQIFKEHVYGILVASTTMGAICDTLSAYILARYLHEGRSGLRRTDHLINRLLAYTVANGGSTAMIDVLTLITMVASPNTNLFLAFALVLMKVYANCALMSLNMRQFQRSALRNPVSVALSDFRVAGTREIAMDVGVLSKSHTSSDPSSMNGV